MSAGLTISYCAVRGQVTINSMTVIKLMHGAGLTISYYAVYGQADICSVPKCPGQV